MYDPNISFDERDPQRTDLSPSEGDATAARPMPDFDTDKTLRFVLPLVGSGRIAVAAIHPVTGKCHGRTFTLPIEQAEFFIWVEKRQIEWNLHFSLNQPVPQAEQQGAGGRIRKSDLSTLRGIVVDIDPSKNIEAQPGGFERERKRLVAQALRWADDPNGPSGIVDSGGGVQAVYLFPEPLPATDENVAAVEAQSRGLAKLFGGDDTHDAVHLFRLPHTINWPNAAKRARGRKPAETLGWVIGPRRWHTLESLAKLAPPIARKDSADPAPPFDTDEAWAAAGSPEALSEELAEQIDDACARDGRFDKMLRTVAPAAGSQKRSHHDFALACAAVEAGITDRSDVAAIVAAYGSDKYEEKLTDAGRGSANSYLVNTVDNAFAKIEAAKADDLALLTPIQDEDGTAGGTSEEEASGVAFGEPVDIFNDDDPASASTALVDALPGPIAAHARVLAARMGTSVDFAAVTAVAVLAAAIGGALKLRVHEHDTDFEVTALIAIVLVGRPGRKKSPLVKALMKALRKIDAEMHARSAQRWAEWRAKHCTAKGTPKPGAPPPPPWQQVIVDNATVEKLIAIIADNPGGLLLDPDELMAFLGIMDAYKRNGGGDRGLLLRILDAAAVSLERKSGSTRSKGAPTGMIATTQPDKIRTLTRDLGSDGFLQRLIFVMDDGIEREGIDAPTDPHAAAKYERAVRNMFDIRHVGGGTVYLSPEARAVLTATWRRIHALRALPGASAAWEGHVSKWEGFLYRIALTFHALDTWAVLDTMATGPGVPVTAETARRASRFALALVAHALRFYGEYYEPAEHNTEAREIAGYLLAHPDKTSFTPREIEKARRALQGNRRLTLATMGELERFGWLAVAERTADGPAKWAVNPRIHERFAEGAEREKLRRAQQQADILAALSARKGLSDDV